MAAATPEAAEGSSTSRPPATPHRTRRRPGGQGPPRLLEHGERGFVRWDRSRATCAEAYPKDVGENEGLHLDSIGRQSPPWGHHRRAPGRHVRCARPGNRAEGLATGFQAGARHLEQAHLRPARSGVLPPRARYVGCWRFRHRVDTVSTMAPSELGPPGCRPWYVADEEGRVPFPWPRRGAGRHPSTWLMLPGGRRELGEKTVWTASTTSAAGFSSSTSVENALERGLGHRKSPPSMDDEALAEHLDMALDPRPRREHRCRGCGPSGGPT